MRKDSGKGKLQSLKRTVTKIIHFLSRWYVWSGLLLGFLWTFPVPFVLAAFLSPFQSLPEQAKWILFFPFESSLLLTQWITDWSSRTLMVWAVAVFIGMFLGVVFMYCVHRIRVRRGTRK